MSWSGQSVVVTGAASGLGLALATEWGLRGARVWLADVDRDALDAAVDGLVGRGLDVRAVELDVTDESAFGGVVQRVVDEHGRLDVLVNNAAIDVTAEVADLSLERWRAVLDVNLHGVVHGIHHGYRQMVDQGGGLLVNVASGAGLIAFPTSIPYTASKAAVVGLTRALRAEAEVHAVRVALVFPGMMHTRIQDHEGIGIDRPAFLARVPASWIAPSASARRIVDGLERGEHEITTQWRNRVGAMLVTLLPGLGHRIRKGIVREFQGLALPRSQRRRS